MRGRGREDGEDSKPRSRPPRARRLSSSSGVYLAARSWTIGSGKRRRRSSGSTSARPVPRHPPPPGMDGRLKSPQSEAPTHPRRPHLDHPPSFRLQTTRSGEAPPSRQLRRGTMQLLRSLSARNERMRARREIEAHGRTLRGIGVEVVQEAGSGSPSLRSSGHLSQYVQPES